MKTAFIIIVLLLFNWLIFQPSSTSSTLFPILIAAQAIFLVPQLKTAISKWLKVLLAIILLTAIMYLIYSKSRAAWLGGAAGFMVVLWLNGKLNKRKLLWLLCAGVVTAAFALTFFMKTGSSNGRLLIYKVIAYNLSTNNLLTGIGAGQFKAQYNPWQAQYFEHHDINSSEALLADNTFFAFNDYWQLVIENGIIGILLFLIAFTCFFLLIRKLKGRNRPGEPATGAAASIMMIATAALFSYPFQNLWIVAYAIYCFAVLLYVIVKHRVLRYLFTGLAISVGILFSWKALYLQKQERLKKKAIFFAHAGNKRECLQLLKGMIANGCKDGHVFYLYAKELYLAGQVNSALVYLKRSARYINTLESCRLFAKIYEEQSDTVNAERYYLTAVYMVPNRFESRYEVLQFYMQQKDKAKAGYWANSIIQLPVKVPSQRVTQIRVEADSLLKIMYAGH